MDTEVLTIRQMCDTYDVTPRTLRFYEAKELISPIRDGQKRLYTKRDRARLTLILRGKRFGFSLESIRQLLDLYYIGDQQATQMQKTYELALERLAELELQYSELGETITDLKKHIAWGEEVIAQNKMKQTG